MFEKSSNPVLSEKKLRESARHTGTGAIISEGRMTIAGAINKTMMLAGLMMITTYYSYLQPSQMLMWIGLGGGFAAVMFASFKPQHSAIVAPIYALLKGLFVGSVSAYFAASHGGIVFQAVSLTLGTLVAMLMIHKSGLIKVTSKFRTGVMMATGAIMFVYVISIIGSFVGFTVPYLHESGPIGIGISVVIIGVASLNLLLDFDLFEKGEEQGAPEYMEWFAGMALLVTLVWLYIEFLRLLSKLQSD